MPSGPVVPPPALTLRPLFPKAGRVSLRSRLHKSTASEIHAHTQILLVQPPQAAACGGGLAAELWGSIRSTLMGMPVQWKPWANSTCLPSSLWYALANTSCAAPAAYYPA